MPLPIFLSFFITFFVCRGESRAIHKGGSLRSEDLVEHHHRKGVQDLHLNTDQPAALKLDAARLGLNPTDEGGGVTGSVTTSKSGIEAGRSTSTLSPGDPDDPMDVQADYRRTMDKMKNLNVKEQFQRDTDEMRSQFLPNFKPKPRTLPAAASILVIACVWFGVYYKFIYESDRRDGLERWAKLIEAAEIQKEDGFTPDMVFVFHHPEHDHPDHPENIHPNSLKKILHASLSHGDSQQSRKDFLKCHELQEAASRGSESTVSKTLTQLHARTGRLLTGDHSPRKEDPEETPISKVDVRVAILQDLYKALPKWGFSVSIASSVDDDEIFLSVALDDPEAMKLFLMKRNASLQVQDATYKNLGIEYDYKEHVQSGPFVPFDVRTVERLHKENVLKTNDPLELYKGYYGTIKTGCLVSSHDSIRIIFQELSQHLDLDAAVQEGMLVKWYAVHNQFRISHLRLVWANFRQLLDWHLVQPIPYIKEYFGSRVAFMCAWNGFQCKALLALVPISLMCMVLNRFEDGNGIEAGQILGFNAALIAWARMTCNQWDREEEYFVGLWDDGKEDHSVRPQFHGNLEPSLVNAKVLELQYPANKYAARKFLSHLVTFSFCCLVALCVHTWMQLFEGKLGLIAGLALAVQIKIFQFTYNVLADALVDWENHKYADDHTNSYLWKQFIFQSINNYAAFFYLTVYQARSKAGCPDDNCLPELRKQLVITMVILSLCRMAEVCLAGALVKFNLWYEDYQLEQKRKAGSTQTTPGDTEGPKRSYLEEQAKYAEFRMKDQINVMLQLMISLGHTLIFGSVVPAVVPFCFAVFCVNLRASAWLLSNYGQRPFPRKSHGIGGWKDVDSLLRRVGVFFSGFLLVAHGTLFKDTLFIVRLSGFLLYCITMGAVWLGVNSFYPAEDDDAKLMVLRRAYVERQIRERGLGETAPANLPKGGRRLSALGTLDVQQSHCVADGRWTEIPHFDGSFEENQKSA